MKYLLVMILVATVCFAATAVKPWYPELKWMNDTLHVTTSEQGWALSARSYQPLIINDTGGWLHFRFDTEGGSIYSLIGISGSGPTPPPFVLVAPVDSVFIDAEIAGTVYVEWYAVP